MGRFAERWSDQHRAAVSTAVLDDNLTMAETLRRALRGELAGLDAFDMPNATARGYVAQERARRDKSAAAAAVSENAGATADAILQRALTVVDREMSKLERKAEPDLVQLERLAKTAAGIRKMAGAPQSSPSQPSPESTEPDASSQVDSMLDTFRRRQAGTNAKPDQDTDTGGKRDTSVTLPIHASSHPDSSEPPANHSLPHVRTDGEETRPSREDVRAQLTAA